MWSSRGEFSRFAATFWNDGASGAVVLFEMKCGIFLMRMKCLQHKEIKTRGDPCYSFYPVDEVALKVVF